MSYHFYSLCLSALFAISSVPMAQAQAYLEGIKKHAPLASSIPENGDLNPYAIVVAPESFGKIQKGDVLVDNFNNISNLQGTGGTIVSYSPSTKAVNVFAKLPQDLAQCPGGVGLTTAMTILSSGWVIVGSTPSKDGTTATKGKGCLIVLNSQGEVKAVWAGANINGPWGNIALKENANKASMFVSMAGFDVPAPTKIDPVTKEPIIVKKGTVVRFDVSVSKGGVPKIGTQTVVASGLSQRADKDVFLIGPTGLGLVGNTLYISDTVENRILSITDALTRKLSAGTGNVVTQNGLLQRPLAMTVTPNNTLLTTNGKNGQVVEIDPSSGKQLIAKWINDNQAQTPPGSGNLFGLTMTPDGSGFYYVEDDTNMISKAAK